MKATLRPFAALAMLLFLLTAAPLARAQSITNGTFQSPSVSTFVHQPSGVPGWSFSFNSGISNNSNYTVVGGSSRQFAYLQWYAGNAGSISQSVNFAAGNYTLSWVAAGRNTADGGGGTCTYTVKVNNVTVYNGSTAGSQAFTARSVSFSFGAAGTYPVTFTNDTGSGDNTCYIDTVSLSFTPFAPTATTGAATSVTGTTATLNGTVNPNGDSTAVTFQYGTTTSYGLSATAAQSPVTGVSNTSVSAAISGLTPGTLYHYRISATNSAGTTNSSDGTFTTLSNNANLSNLVLNSATLSPSFASGTTSYTASVPYATTSLTVTPTKADANATIKVNGTTVASGSASGAIPLAVGANTISTVVTAQDGTTKTYTVTVTRPLVWTYSSASEVPATGSSFTAGGTATLALNFAPTTGADLMVLKNTGLGFISGQFSNLAQGQAVTLTYAGVTYDFVANYYGGTGNDLVLQWAKVRPVAWGLNGSGQLGNNSTTQSTVPTSVLTSGVLSGKTVVAAAAGQDHSVALCSDGTLAAWGRNDYGQLGNNSTTQSTVPVAVTTSGVLAGKTVVAVAAGSQHSFALCSDGTLAAWGWNVAGQLGNNSTNNSSVPVAVNTSGALSGKTVVAVAAGFYHSVALCSDGTVAAWGNNFRGQLGNGSTNASNSPAAVSTSGGLSGKTVVAIAAGGEHSMALCSDGTLATWGFNFQGQLGNNGSSDSSVPVVVSTSGVLSGKTVVAISGGQFHSLALCSDGTVATWGSDSAISSRVPVAVSTSGVLSGKTVVAVAAGQLFSVALCSDGTVAAWGSNGQGQLGNNSTSNSSVPVAVNTSTLAADERFTKATSGSNASHTFALVAAPPDTTPPTLSPVTIASSNANTAWAKQGNTVTLTFTANEPIQPPSVTLLGSAATAVNTSGNTWTASATVGAGTAEGAATFSITATDLAGNTASVVTATTNGSAVTVDRTAPTLTLPADIVTTTTNAAPKVVTFSAGATDALDPAPNVTATPPSGSSFPVGLTTVNVTSTDAAGNSASGSFTVRVFDDTIYPEFTVNPSTVGYGQSVTFSAAASTHGDPRRTLAAYFWDFGDTTAGGGPFVMHAYSAAGTYTARLTVIDDVGKTAETARLIIVTDNVPPVLTLPGNLTREATSSAGAIVTYSASTSDPGSGVASSSFTPASGSTFPLGTTTVNATATDNAGNTATGSFTVTVRDTTPPALGLPASPLVAATTSASGAAVTFSVSASDLVDGAVTATATPASGSTFAIGDTTVNVLATDAHGNTASGSFVVRVQQTFLVTLSPIPNGVYGSSSPQTAVVKGESLTLGIDVNPGYAVDQWLVNGVVVQNGGLSYTLTNVMKDSLVQVTTYPTFRPSIFVESPAGNRLSDGGVAVDFGSATIGSPSVTKTFTVRNLSDVAFTDIATLTGLNVLKDGAAGGDFTVDTTGMLTTIPPGGSTSFTVAFAPTRANTRAAALHIANNAPGSLNPFDIPLAGFGVDTTPPVLTLPGNLTVEATSTAGAVVTYSASASDPGSDVASSSFTPPSGSTFPIGTTVVNATATDGSGNTATSSFTVTVSDTTPPEITVPADIVAEATSPAGAAVTFTTSATDAVYLWYRVISPESGSTFPIGTTTVTVTAFDIYNNTSSRSFTVTVRDSTAPLVTVPADITTPATSAAGAAVSFSVSASDEVDGGVTAIPDHASGSTFPVGTTTINVTAADSAGNTGSRSFTVTVIASDDANLASLAVTGVTLKPAFDPAITAYTATVGNAVTSTTVSASAAFDGATILQEPANPVSLSVGSNAVSVKVTGQNGATKTYTVVVKRTGADTKKPVVTLTAPTMSTVAGVFTISGKVNEAIGLASVTVRLNGVALPLDAPLASDTGAALPFTVSNAAPENGTNTISVEALDYNGNLGTATRTITYMNNRPGLVGTYNALLVPAGTPNVDTSGLVTVTVTATGSFSGSVLLSGLKVPISGVLKNDGAARFKPALGTSFDLIDKTEFDSYLGALALSVSDPAGLSGTLSTQASGGAVLANFAGKVAPYSATNQVPVVSGFLNQPVGPSPTKGVYTVVFPSKEQTPPLAPSAYPQGDGFATMTLTNAGAVSLSGYLADGTKYTAAGKLRVDGSVPLFTQLYRKGGAMAGEVIFAPGLPNTDVSGVNFLWLRPALSRARYYRDGWENGVRVDAVGAKYASPASLNFGQGAAVIGSGNAALVFSDGLLARPVTQAVSVDPGTGAVKLIPATNLTYKLSLTTSTGLFSGTFTHDGVTDAYRGILLNKGVNQGGFGYFLSTPPPSYGITGQSGGVSLDPAGP